MVRSALERLPPEDPNYSLAQRLHTELELAGADFRQIVARAAIDGVSAPPQQIANHFFRIFDIYTRTILEWQASTNEKIREARKIKQALGREASKAFSGFPNSLYKAQAGLEEHLASLESQIREQERSRWASGAVMLKNSPQETGAPRQQTSQREGSLDPQSSRNPEPGTFADPALSKDPPQTPNGRSFPVRACWLDAELKKRGVTASQLSQHWDGPSYHSIQRILDQQSSNEPTLSRLARALSSTRSDFPVIRREDIPDD